MSITLNVYARGPLMSRELLMKESRNPGLPKEFRWELRFVRDDDSGKLDATGALGESQYVAGWRTDAKQGRELIRACEKHDQKVLNSLYKANAYGMIDLFVFTPESDEWSALSEPDFLESIPEEYRAIMKGATVWYMLETSATRNELSLELQEQLWRMLGVLTGGVLEDPQEGIFESGSGDDE